MLRKFLQTKNLAFIVTFLLVTNAFAQIQITFPLNRIVFQRNNQNLSTFNVTGFFTGSADSIQARLVPRVVGQGTLVNWQRISQGITNSNFCSTMTATGGWYSLEIRSWKNGSITNNTTLDRVGVGEVFLIVGHSNAQGNGYPNIGGAADDRVSCVDVANPASQLRTYEASGSPNDLPLHFDQLGASSGMAPFSENPWFWGKLGDRLVAKFNVPVLFFSAAFGGSSMWHNYRSVTNQPFTHPFISYNQRMPYVNIRNTFIKYTPVVGLRAILSGHGINDASFASNSKDTIKYHYQTVINKSRQESGYPNLAWMVAIAAYDDGVKAFINQGQLELTTNNPNVFRGPNLDQIDNSGRIDKLHFNQNGQNLAAQYWEQSITSNFLSATSPIMPNASSGSGGANSPNISSQSNCGNSILSVSNCNGSLSWSNGATSSSIVVNSSGTYTATCTVGGCGGGSASNSINVNVSVSGAAPSISASGPTAFCAGGQVTLTSSSGNAYRWSNGSQSQSITVNTSGTYSVQTVNSQGCLSAAAQINVEVRNTPNAPYISAQSTTTFCQGGQVVLQSNQTINNIWSTGATTNSITVSQSGNYSIRIAGVDGCDAYSNTITVTVNPTPNTPTINPERPTSFCSGDYTTLVASEATRYNWNTGQSSQRINPSIAGTYFLSVTDANGCTSSNSAPITVKVNAPPAAPVISIDRATPEICLGDYLTITSNSQSNYIWSDGSYEKSIRTGTSGSYHVRTVDANNCLSPVSNIITVIVDPTPNKPVITASKSTTLCQGQDVTLSANYGSSLSWSNGLSSSQIVVGAAGTYNVRYKDSNGCESISDNVTVKVNALPNAPSIMNEKPVTFCQNDNTILAIPQSPNQYSYKWSTGQTSQKITIVNAATISATVTDLITNCTSPASGAIQTIVNPLPTAPILTTNRTPVICASENVVFSANAQTNYSWSTGATTQNITVNKGGLYSVRAVDVNNCISLPSNIVELTVNQLPKKPVISAYGPTTFCLGKNLGLEADYSTGIRWNTGESSKQISVATAGAYSVIYRDANGCESTSDPIVTTVSPLPETPQILNERPTTFCENDSTILAITLPPTSYSFKWNNGTTGPKTTVKNAGDVTAIVIYLPTGCTSLSSSKVPITVNPNPAQPIITTSGSTVLCEQESVTLTANEPTATIYEWSLQINGKSIIVGKEGNYSVRAGNQFGCTSIFSKPIYIKVNPLPATPIITASGPIVFCDGDQVTLKVENAGTPFWNTGESTTTIVAKTTGNYVVRIKDANGCSSAFSSTTKIETKPLPETPLIDKYGIYSIGVTNPNNQGSYIWKLDDKPLPDIKPLVKATADGKYQAQVSVKYSPVLTCYSKPSAILPYVVDRLAGGLGVYPNPVFNGVLHIETLEQIKNATVSIYSSAGRLVQVNTIPIFDENTQIDIKSLPPGTYIVEVTAVAYRITKKILVDNQ
jgi:Secretion system C-terminal sorting domain